MKRYINYFKYILRHKWYVIRGALKIAPFNIHLLYRCLIHDMSKFKPSEFIPYAKCFYKPDGTSQYDETNEFIHAWNLHQKYNKHHWQFWILKYDRGDNETLSMDDIYIYEMVADWIGAGWAISGKWDNVFTWYRERSNVDKYLHPTTKNKVEEILKNLEESR